MIDLFTGHAGVMGQNFMTMVLGLMVAFYYGRLALRTASDDPSRLLMLGIAVSGFGWAVHRGYWWLWRFELQIGNETGAAFFVSNADWLLIVVSLIGISYLIHLSRWAKSHFGVWAWPASIAGAVCVFVIGALPGVLA